MSSTAPHQTPLDRARQHGRQDPRVAVADGLQKLFDWIRTTVHPEDGTKLVFAAIID